MLKTLLALSLVASAAACGGSGDDLDPDTVTNLPPGDATGSAATGTYVLDTLTTACGGTCAVEVDGFNYSACDVGTRQTATTEIAQDGGALVFDVEDSDYASHLEGGIDVDGSFDVGGLVTQQGGQITITSRSTGTLIDGAMTATGRLRIDGMGLGCTVEIDVTGER